VLLAGGDAAKIIREREAGIVVAPGDRAGLVAALQALAADPVRRQRLGENGRAAAVELFNRPNIVAGFIALLLGLTTGPRGAGMQAVEPPVGDAPVHTIAPRLTPTAGEVA
jgi:glycosyltransferase involved in cell wall biosynthesis